MEKDDTTHLQGLSDMAHRLRLHSIEMTDIAGSG